MSKANELWQRVYEGFAYQGDPTPQAGLNRIAAKCLKLAKPPSFDPSNCDVQEKFLIPDEFRHFERYHERENPRREGGSIVVLFYQGKGFVLDGHNRISKCLKEGTTEPRSVLIIQLKPTAR
jgi:hypothetical protein